ncbi:MAG: hypothetical protein LBR14_00270 [Clostridiales Family XIII bacterium]|jgi:ABC-2 type transport system permease protein|nr:hypothetical protein [Clostridiales Family XIII bacterium]
MIRHDLKLCFRGMLPLTLAGLCVLLVFVPLGTAAVPGDSIFEVEVTHDQMKWRFIADGFVPLVQGFCVLLGLALGFAAFRFVLDPARAQLIFALGLKRGVLYRNRALAGTYLLLLAIMLPLAVSLCLNIASVGAWPGVFAAWVYVCGGLFVTALAAFCCAALGCLLAGVAGEALFFGATLLTLPYAVSYAAGAFLKYLLWGNPYGASPYLGPGPIRPQETDLAVRFDPLRFFYADLQTHRMFYRPLDSGEAPGIEAGAVLIWGAVCVLLLILGSMVFNARRVEQAGFAFKSQIMLNVSTFGPSLFAGAFVFSLGAVVGVWFGCVLGIAVFAVCLAVAARGAGLSDTRKSRRVIAMALPIAVKTALALALAAGAASGFGAYGSLPDEAEVTSVRVSYVGSPNVLGIAAYGSSTATSYYISAAPAYTDADDIRAAVAVHRLFDESGRLPLAKDEADFAGTVVPYDIRFDYVLRDGTQKTWYYDRASLMQLEQVAGLTPDAGLAYALGGSGDVGDDGSSWAREAYLSGSVYLADPTYREIFSLGLSKEDRTGLLAAIRADEAALSFADRYYPSEEALGILMFTPSGADDLVTWSYHLSNAFIFVSPAHEQTLAFLKEHDLWLETYGQGAAEAADITRLILQDYDPYIGMNAPTFPQSPYFMSYISERSDDFRIVKDFGNPDEIRDPEQIAEIAPALRSTYLLTGSGSLAAVQYEGSDKWVYLFLPGEYKVNGDGMQ